MAHYILLLTLTPEGRERMLRNADSVVKAANEIEIPDVMSLGLYAVLGDYDFVNIVEAPDNDAVARYALEFGVRAGAHTATLPAVPVAHLHEPLDRPRHEDEAAEAQPPEWRSSERERWRR